MEWTLRTESSGNALTDAHQRAFHEVADLYHGQNPYDIETYRARAHKLEQQFSLHHRQQLVAALRKHMTALGAGAASMGQLERLLDPRSVAVVTGQQAGLFTGPLYAFYKALSAIGWAARLERELERPVVPVFWVASEDHDWGEVDHAYILDKADEIRKIRLPQEVALHQMVFHTELDPAAVQAAVAEVARCLPEGPHKDEVLQDIEQSFAAGMSMSDWFGKLLLKMVEPRGIVLLDPCLPELRQLVAGCWTRTFDQLATLQDRLDRVYEQVAQRGFQPLVVRDPLNTTMFYVRQGKRYVLETTGDNRLRARGLGVEKPLPEWRALAEEHPEQFSSNVLLRPVVQDYLLPTLVYLGGPAEVSYHALAGAVFEVHNRQLPPLMLRHRLRLFTPTVVRHMAKWGLTADDLAKPLQVSDWLRFKLEGSVLDDAFAELRNQTRERWQGFAQQFARLGPQVQDMAARQIDRELAGIDRLHRKTKRLFDLNHETELRQLHHVNRWLWTDGAVQERRLSPLNTWAKYGLRWLVESPLWMESSGELAAFDVYL
jgi:bacillithiol biosynthesis cysteine-adding enzyme BshC